MSVISQLPRRDILLASSRFINIKSYKSYFSTKKLIVIALGHLAIDLLTIFREALTTATWKFSLRQSMWEFFRNSALSRRIFTHIVNFSQFGHLNDSINKWQNATLMTFENRKKLTKIFYSKKQKTSFIWSKLIQKKFVEGFLVSFAFGILKESHPVKYQQINRFSTTSSSRNNVPDDQVASFKSNTVHLRA